MLKKIWADAVSIVFSIRIYGLKYFVLSKTGRTKLYVVKIMRQSLLIIVLSNGEIMYISVRIISSRRHAY